MAEFYATDEIERAYLESDCSWWVREHLSGTQVDGRYKLDADVNGRPLVVSCELLIYKATFQDDGKYTLALSCNAHGTPFPVYKEERSIILSGEFKEVSDARWSGLDDPVIDKAHKIAKLAPYVAPGSRSTS